jgi:hypothetical protein
MRGKQGDLKGSSFLACDPALGAADEVSPLEVVLSLSLSPQLTKARVDAVVVNRV